MGHSETEAPVEEGAASNGDQQRGSFVGAQRQRLPDERASVTHKFSVGGTEGYITVGMYEDGRPGEVFIKMSKEGSTLSGVMDGLALTLSIGLQYGVPLKVLVDKLINTRFGRKVGDIVLRHVVHQLRQCLRVGDVVFPNNSDDFVVFLNEGDRAIAKRIAQRIFAAFAAHPVVLSESVSFHVAVSIGFALAPADGRSLSELLKVAGLHSSPGPSPSQTSIH